MLLYCLLDSTVAFSAYISNSTSLLNKTIFDMVLTNEHQAYDVSTGVFTCPISGIYMFSFVAGTLFVYSLFALTLPVDLTWKSYVNIL